MKSKQFLFFLMDIAVFIRAGYWDKFHDSISIHKLAIRFDSISIILDNSYNKWPFFSRESNLL